MRSPVAQLLADLADALQPLAVPWYLFGARAAILHGVARLTADVDVTVRLPDAVSTEALVTALAQHGFTPRVTDAAFITRTRVVPFVHAQTMVPLDVVIGGPGLEDQFLERAQSKDVEGLRVPVASAEDIAIMKMLAGRPKDLDDIVAIVCANEGLDMSYIRTTLTLLEDAIGQSDLVPTLEAALTRARAR